MNAHFQLRPKGTNLKDEKLEVCSGIPIEKYDISKLNQKLEKGSNVKMKDIYSSHINGSKITNRKASIAGVV